MLIQFNISFKMVEYFINFFFYISNSVMKRLKGYSFKLANQEIILKDLFSNTQPSFDCIFFSTNIEGQLCKVYQLENDVSQLRFLKERNVLEQLKNQRFVTFINTHEFVFKKNRYGILIFQNIRKGSLLADEFESIKQKDVIATAKNILKVLEVLHSNNISLLAIKLDAITSSMDKSSAIPIEYSLLLDKPLDQNGLSQSPIHRQFLDSGFKYKSPELLDSFSKDLIDWRSDIFAFGCLLYELTYKTYPFETPLGVINLSLQNIDETKSEYKTINQIVKQCLVKYTERPTASKLLSCLNEQSSSAVSLESKENKKSIFDQFKNALTIMTTQSQKWIFKYIQANGKAPDEDMVNQLLTKVYKNNDKLQKIYNLIQKHTIENIKSIQSILKVLCLLWNFIRKGPPAVLDDYSQNISTIIKTTEKLKYDNLIQQVSIILSLKLIIADEFKYLLEGNFCLNKLQTIKQINANTLMSLIDYLKNVVETYQKLVNPPAFLCLLFFDQMYDLCCSLILLYLSINKDVQKKRRKQQAKLSIIEKELNKAVSIISKLNRAQLHVIASLDTLENYKHFFQFEAVENVKVSAFQLFYKTDIVYHNLRLPSSFKSINKGQQVSLEDDDDEDYEHIQEKHINGLINVKNSNKQKQVATGTGSTEPERQQKSKVSDFQVEWGNKKPKQQFNKNNGFDNVFGNNLAKSTFVDLQFSQKTNQPKQKSSFQQFLAPRPRQKSMMESFLHPQKTANKPVSKIDFFDFDFPTKKVQQKQAKPIMNFDFLNPSKSNVQLEMKTEIVNQPKKASPLLLQFCNSLKDQNLKQLVLSSNIVVDFKSLKLSKVIGCGNAGQVYEGTLQDKTVAIKKIKSKQQNPNAHKQFQRQITTLIIIGKHIRLNSLIGLSKHETDYYLLMDYCAGGNLFELLHRRLDLTVPWKIRIIIAKQIAEGMNYLHVNCKIIHRDLKSLNILIANKFSTGEKITQDIVAKITDFGLARKPDEFMTNALGTLHWMAPQLLEGKSYDYKVDVYSFGIVLWQLCCRQTPYQQFRSPHLIIKHVALNGGRPDLKSVNEGCPEELKNLMTKCWSTNPSFRPNFQSIVQVLGKIGV